MFDIDFTPAADDTFDRLSVGDGVEVLHKLELVERHGLATEQKIGEVNQAWSVYLLIAGALHVCAVTCEDEPVRISVTFIGTFALTTIGTKQTLIDHSMTQIGFCDPYVSRIF